MPLLRGAAAAPCLLLVLLPPAALVPCTDGGQAGSALLSSAMAPKAWCWVSLRHWCCCWLAAQAPC